MPDFREQMKKPVVLVLAPMMIGSNRTFRRIAHRYGADILGGEMAHSGKVAKQDRRELALISARHEEGCFSAQICGCKVETMVKAAQVIADRGAAVIDINAGCPMHFVTQFGSGSALLESRNRLARIVEGIKKAVALPVSVKLRTGFYTEKPRCVEVAKTLESAGVDAIALHARSREQFYDAPADWKHIRDVVNAVKIPVIGNGDIQSHEDALRMLDETGCAGVMIGRAALQRPWIFQEIRERRAVHPTPAERWALIDEHRQMIQETFGIKMAFDYMRWHAGWYVRWREDQSQIRARWKDLPGPDDLQTFLNELQQITLEGPAALPQPNLSYSQVEAG